MSHNEPTPLRPGGFAPRGIHGRRPELL